MVSSFNSYSRAGYYKAPLSKGWMIITGGMSAVLTLALRPYQDVFQFSVATLNDPLQMWRLPVSRLAFLSVRDSLCGLLLLYYIRIFERRWGSKQFASYLFCTGVLATMIEVAAHAGLEYHQLNILRYVSPGPLSMLFALLVPYFCNVPASSTRSILGLQFSSKTVAYILWFQLMFSSPEVVVGSFSGIVSALLYKYNVLWIRKLLFVPDWLSRLSGATFGRVLASRAPFPGIVPLGATLEIQRQQRVEFMEQQMLLDSFRRVSNINQNHYPRAGGVADGNPWVRRTVGQLTPRWPTGNHSNNVSPRQQHNPQNIDNVNRIPDTIDSNQSHSNQSGPAHGDQAAPAVPPLVANEVHVTTLTDMGFSRSSALQALIASNNDMHLATNILLQE